MYSKYKVEDFNYKLNNEKIAFYPIEERDHSKLLIYDNKYIKEDLFLNVSKYLPHNSLLVFNNTKVVKARLKFHKPTGADIEIFCLEPTEHANIENEFNVKHKVVWNCLVGNSRRWTSGILSAELNIDSNNVTVSAQRLKILTDHSEILFSWNGEYTFADILESFGKIPLPPYIHRDVVQNDNVRYQTVYALENGSVAAPTAGFHFTSKLIDSLMKNGIDTAYLTLHVGLGTFKPVNEEYIDEHEMHSERIALSKNIIEKLFLSYSEKSIIPVGTTSCRSLESLFWLGVKLIENPKLNGVLYLNQWYPYECDLKDKITVKQSLETILEWLEKQHLNMFEAYTSLMIIPEYRCRLSEAIITNFHQPKSTLLLLISSFIGDDWKKVYKYAIENNFRFLSYGDSCLFFNKYLY